MRSVMARYSASRQTTIPARLPKPDQSFAPRTLRHAVVPKPTASALASLKRRDVKRGFVKGRGHAHGCRDNIVMEQIRRFRNQRIQQIAHAVTSVKLGVCNFFWRASPFDSLLPSGGINC